MFQKRFGNVVYNGTYDNIFNLGDDVQSIAAEQLLPRVDYNVDRERMDRFTPRGEDTVHVLLNGWFTHAPHHWPPSRFINPLITSFHVSRGRGASGFALSAHEVFFEGANREWLERFSPIGCRDLDTMEQCRAAGLDAFFSGCLTLTLKRPDVARDSDLIVLNDVPLSVIEKVYTSTKKNIVLTQHFRSGECDKVRRTKLTHGLLELYARASCVVTTKLHCAMPCLAFETPVLLLDTALDQYRFSGLNKFLLHSPVADFLADQVEFRVDSPPLPRADHMETAKALVDSVRQFVES